MKHVLAYNIRKASPVVGTARFDTKKSAQLFDTFLKQQYGETFVVSKLIYDDASEDKPKRKVK